MNLQCISHGTLTLCVHMGIGIHLRELQPSEKELSSLISPPCEEREKQAPPGEVNSTQAGVMVKKSFKMSLKVIISLSDA